MPYVNLTHYDAGLSSLRSAVTHLHLTVGEATSHADMLTKTVGNKPSPSIAAPADDGAGGRKLVLAQITSGGVITESGTFTHWALSDDTGEVLHATGDATDKVVVDGDTFTTAGAIDIWTLTAPTSA